MVTLNDLIDISEPSKNEKTIFVWPEGILPDITQENLNDYNYLFKEKFNENHLLIIGINSEILENGSKHFFNSFHETAFTFFLEEVSYDTN